MFKGTPTRTAKEIADEFDAVGGDVNAFTGKEYTCYYSRVLDEDLPMALDVLSDMITNSLDRRRGARIRAESDPRRDRDARGRSRRAGARSLLSLDVGRPSAGTPGPRVQLDDLRGVPRRGRASTGTSATRPSNLVVAAAGHVEHDKLVDQLEESSPSAYGTPHASQRGATSPQPGVDVHQADRPSRLTS